MFTQWIQTLVLPVFLAGGSCKSLHEVVEVRGEERGEGLQQGCSQEEMLIAAPYPSKTVVTGSMKCLNHVTWSGDSRLTSVTI